MTSATMCCVTAYYAVLPLLLGVNVARAALYRELGGRIQVPAEQCLWCLRQCLHCATLLLHFKERGGGAEAALAAALHATLLQAGRHMDQLVGSLFPHYLLTSLVMPLVCASTSK